MFRIIKDKLRSETVFTVSLILAGLSCLIARPKIEYIDFKVLASLFNLMIVIAAFEKFKVLDMAAIKILRKYRSERKVSLAIIIITFIGSMLITNDVALITFVPIAIIIAKKSGFNPIKTVILQTMAANIGSSLTPVGNPQNLFLFTFYNIGIADFFRATGLFVFLGLIWLLLLNRRVPGMSLHFDLKPVEIENKRNTLIFIALFILILLSVFRFIDYKLVFVLTLFATILFEGSILKKIDYFLLATFVFFFIIIGNLSSSHLVTTLMNKLLAEKYGAYFFSIALSQFISNVPAAVLVSRFTEHWRPVLLAVNIGGMGTLIASLASLISYKIYNRHYGSNKYLLKFHLYNFLSLLLFSTIIAFFI